MPQLVHSYKGLALFSLLFFMLLATATGEQASDTTEQMRRLNEQQYRNSIADILGENISIVGRFEPELRNKGLLALGSSVASVTSFGFEQFDIIGRSVAAQFVTELKKDTAKFCKQSQTLNESCRTNLLMYLGGQLFRRPLNVNEQLLYKQIAVHISAQKNDNYAGFEASLAGMLVAPPFLFRIEAIEPEPKMAGKFRLTGYAKAQRLSYFLWNTTPDQVLLNAAKSGELHTPAGLNKQVDRLLNSRRLALGVRALFNDMLRFDEFDKLVKDPQVFPRFNYKTAVDAREQTLRTITHHLLTEKADYRQLFTTRKTFLTPALGLLYRVPVTNLDGWSAYTFPDETHAKAGGRAGVLTQASFLALHSHPGRSSVTLRGKAVRELILCQKVPAPPANVSFSVVQDTSNPEYKTTRERVMAHQTDPGCAGCHKITDPIGLALENFDGSGVYQAKENGMVIDTSGDLDGKKYTDAVGLGQAVASHPDTAACLVRRSFEVGSGQALGRTDRQWLQEMTRKFSSHGYSLPALLKQLTISKRFFTPLNVPLEKPAVAALSVGNQVK